MTREEKLEQMSVEELIDALEDAEDQVEERDRQIEELRAEVNEIHDRLYEAADVMAQHGYIHNTPYAKSEWIWKGTKRVQAGVM